MAQIEPKKGNFSKAHVIAFKDDYEAFKKWYDPRFKTLSAKEVWKHIGGTEPKKVDKK